MCGATTVKFAAGCVVQHPDSVFLRAPRPNIPSSSSKVCRGLTLGTIARIVQIFGRPLDLSIHPQSIVTLTSASHLHTAFVISITRSVRPRSSEQPPFEGTLARPTPQTQLSPCGYHTGRQAHRRSCGPFLCTASARLSIQGSHARSCACLDRTRTGNVGSAMRSSFICPNETHKALLKWRS